MRILDPAIGISMTEKNKLSGSPSRSFQTRGPPRIFCIREPNRKIILANFQFSYSLRAVTSQNILPEFKRDSGLDVASKSNYSIQYPETRVREGTAMRKMGVPNRFAKVTSSKMIATWSIITLKGQKGLSGSRTITEVQ